MPKRKPGRLTPKQEAFVREYLVDLNATQAAIRAGYSPKTAKEQGHALLKDERVAEAIAKARVESAQRAGVTAERVLAEYELIAFSRMSRVFDIGDGKVALRGAIDDDAIAAIASIEQTADYIPGGDHRDPVDRVKIKVKFHNKLDALNALAKHLGIDKPDHQRTIEEFLESVRARMSAEAYAQLLRAVQAEMGLADLAPQATGGGEPSQLN